MAGELSVLFDPYEYFLLAVCWVSTPCWSEKVPVMKQLPKQSLSPFMNHPGDITPA
jgi:hypothetical protein